MLQRLRVGACSVEDLKMIDNLVLESDSCEVPDFQSHPWNQAILVTSRHRPKDEWNLASIRRHCDKTGHRWYNCPSEDTYGRKREPLSMEERLAVASVTTKASRQLADNVVIAVGMKAMVTMNIATQADLANGTRGVIESIVLDPRDLSPLVNDETGIVDLKYPPALILFRPDIDDLGRRIDGIEKGLLPIVPAEVGFQVQTHYGSRHIHRQQLSIIPAYAFTHHKCQGQNLGVVLVDLGRPPTGKLGPFNAYVALSRSKGRENIRLLRRPDTSLFTTYPSAALRHEDERLARLNVETKERHDRGQFKW
ncbi:hypothetical protein EDD85DRAFT_784129 [Armillaria nabsnona]|nr:hypothetical protein EDD85DRAFT_784129 [Armillaria nabsnona]